MRKLVFVLLGLTELRLHISTGSLSRVSLEDEQLSANGALYHLQAFAAFLLAFNPTLAFNSAGHALPTLRPVVSDIRHCLSLVSMSETTGKEEPVGISRRDANKLAISLLGAEAAWRQAVAAASAMQAAGSLSGKGILPPDAAEQLEAGRAVVIKDWLPSDVTAALRADAESCWNAGHYSKIKTNFYKGKNNDETERLNNRWVMKNIYYTSKREIKNGPWFDPSIGDFELREKFRDRMAQLKVLLANQLEDRPTLVDEKIEQTHEMDYTWFGSGSYLKRHLDEHHIEWTSPGGGKAKKRPNSSRRSITWIYYINDNWDKSHGGELRVHERAKPSVVPVGARGPDLQLGWLRATATEGEQPVFLDATLPGEDNCILYTFEKDGSRRNLSRNPFSSKPALYMVGGDTVARNFMVDNPADTKRIHLIDAPKSTGALIDLFQVNYDDTGEDGGERVRDIAPEGGTLVLFDSVAMPHEVLLTNRDRFTVRGWFHEKYYDA